MAVVALLALLAGCMGDDDSPDAAPGDHRGEHQERSDAGPGCYALLGYGSGCRTYERCNDDGICVTFEQSIPMCGECHGICECTDRCEDVGVWDPFDPDSETPSERGGGC